jgi:hypothetical protein
LRQKDEDEDVCSFTKHAKEFREEKHVKLHLKQLTPAKKDKK